MVRRCNTSSKVGALCRERAESAHEALLMSFLITRHTRGNVGPASYKLKSLANPDSPTYTHEGTQNKCPS